MDDKIDLPGSAKYALEFISSKTEIWLVLLIDMMVPIWYMKALVPIAIWVGAIIQSLSMEIEYKEVIWIKFIVATLYIICIFAAKALVQWKDFHRKIDNEKCHEAQNDIMDKIPDAIGVIDKEYQVILSNKSFKALCHNKINELSQRIINIKRVSSYSQDKFSVEKDQSRLRLGADDTKQNFISEADFKSQDFNFFGENFCNLSQLLEEIIENPENGIFSAQDYVTFKGNYINLEFPQESSWVYEIKISPLTDSKRITLIFNDITQREKLISLEEVNQYKDRLLATVSHDLRAPINGTITFIENTIEDKIVPTEIKDKYLIPAQSTLPPVNKPHKYCLIFLHGYGMPVNRFLSLFLSPELLGLLEDFKVYIPQAPKGPITDNEPSDSDLFSWYNRHDKSTVNFL